MAVRLRLRIQPLKGPAPNQPIEVVAVVNSGYEAKRPELIVPAPLAARLGLWPSLPPGTTAVDYKTAGGNASVFRILDGGQVAVIVPDRSPPQQTADIVVDPKYDQILMSDELGERLGIVILSLKRGLWRFSDETGEERPSEPRQTW